jgi:hypothetical protein
MHIKIAERLHPFSHLPGTCCILPGTTLRLEIFPALLRVQDLSKSVPQEKTEIQVPLRGPIKDFTVQLDLEKGLVSVWGESPEGYFRYRIKAKDSNQMAFEIEKGWFFSWSEISLVPRTQPILPFLMERLSLGNHKSQDWEMVKRRGDLAEIFPAWLRLGQMIEAPNEISYLGTAALLKTCQNASKMDAYEAFQNLFNAAFEGILSPSLIDNQHQGFNLPPPPAHLSPLLLLTEGAKAIRALFIRCEQSNIFILPCLPPEFHCGRFLHIQTPNGLLDFEWSKKMIRRMVFRAEASGTIQMHFPLEIQGFRLNGQKCSVNKPLEIEKGCQYNFDLFTK